MAEERELYAQMVEKLRKWAWDKIREAKMELAQVSAHPLIPLDIREKLIEVEDKLDKARSQALAVADEFEEKYVRGGGSTTSGYWLYGKLVGAGGGSGGGSPQEIPAAWAKLRRMQRRIARLERFTRRMLVGV